MNDQAVVYTEVRRLLATLGETLLQNEFASATPPSAQAFESDEPFFMNTMSFEDWLLYVFMPRMHAIIDQQQSFPDTCGIAPMAEEVFKPLLFKNKEQLNTIVTTLTKLDEIITAN